ncbi:nicotinate-nucleotide adenylyltransferase [Amphibacillus marinus]|uniref:Probable nicotinate-nucleotide adenylyltransferase n=1 Tax=Amphibacillus marinus TaxID=872970 RepID=A0A1H8NTG0_9BACI|nr:nicotinate-nucleotide adenylyltransferase [Amphibacillus marinus]SEO32916.1 nicotinate-nucleotide adenylyltransferase [Amphibacillus marinus]
MKRIGLLGGTFDPPHIGHLAIADEVYKQLALDEVWFIPSASPPHKPAAHVATKDRIAMLEAAIDCDDRFKLELIEIERQGKSYTIDTLTALIERYPNLSFYFIIGADMVEYLPKWNQVDNLVQLAQFVGVKRPDYQLLTPYPVTLINGPSLDVSSTEIRERLASNQPVHYLVPPKVMEIIKERRLYE